MEAKEKITKLEDSIAEDTKKRDKLDERIKQNKAKLEELQNLEIVNGIKSITLDADTSVDELLTALRKKDIQSISSILSKQDNRSVATTP